MLLLKPVYFYNLGYLYLKTEQYSKMELDSIKSKNSLEFAHFPKTGDPAA